MDYDTIITAVLIGLTIIEQILGHFPEGYPHSLTQIFAFIFLKIFRLFKPINQPSDIHEP